LLVGFVASGALAQQGETLSGAVWSLTRIQAQNAAGDPAAVAAQRQALARIGARIRAADPKQLRSRGDLAAVAIYLLSGGAPEDAARLLKDRDFRERAPEAFGAYAYATGNQREAVKALGASDPRTLDPRLGALCAYALSVLKTEDDRSASLALLDQARLLAPGTLVEEVALRRELLLLARSGDREKIPMLMRQYYRRFPRSPYEPEFADTLAATIVQRAAVDEAIADQALEGARPMPLEKRISFLLGLAREFLVIGAYRPCRTAAEVALSLARSQTEAGARARFYYLAAGLLLGAENAGPALEAFDATLLPAPDRRLLAASFQMLERTRAPAANADPARLADESSVRSRYANTLLAGERALGATALQLAKAPAP
jgi:chemotaxis protein MotC